MAFFVGFGAMLMFRFLVVCLEVGAWAVCLLARRVAGTCCGSALCALCRSQQAPTTRLWVVEDSFGFGVLVFSSGCRCFFITTLPVSLSSPSSLPFVHLLLAPLPLSLLGFCGLLGYFFSAT